MVFVPLAVAEAAAVAVAELSAMIGEDDDYDAPTADTDTSGTSQIRISAADAPAYLAMVERERQMWADTLARRKQMGQEGRGCGTQQQRQQYGLGSSTPTLAQPLFSISDSLDLDEVLLIDCTINRLYY
jgi:hypothetical protein